MNLQKNKRIFVMFFELDFWRINEDVSVTLSTLLALNVLTMQH